jgi:signal peptidase II
MLRWLRALALVGLLPAVVGCDHTTKHLAERWLVAGRAVDVVPGVLDLRLAKNRDSAFSLLGDLITDPARRILLLVLTGIAIVALLAFTLRTWQAASPGMRVGCLVLLGGAAGNFVERLVRGYVVDFIHLAYWPVFNLADVAICAGVGLVWLAAGRARAAPG